MRDPTGPSSLVPYVDHEYAARPLVIAISEASEGSEQLIGARVRREHGEAVYHGADVDPLSVDLQVPTALEQARPRVPAAWNPVRRTVLRASWPNASRSCRTRLRWPYHWRRPRSFGARLAEIRLDASASRMYVATRHTWSHTDGASR